MNAAESTPEFVVVIDPGHGGSDSGAVDNGVKEKDINLAVAKRLRDDLLRNNKDMKVVMTRSNDTFVTLQGRADIANKNKADLFISIHTNSVDAKNPNRKSVAGASVYALGLHKDKDNLNVAKRENSVISLEKDHNETYSGFDPNKDESYIIFEMTQKKYLEQSLRFADYAQKQLVATAGRKDRGVKQAGFWVLWATSMPAVLVELDFICNPTSAEYMSSTQGERKMAEALCKAVEQYYNAVKSSGLSGKRPSPPVKSSSGSHAKAASKSTTASKSNGVSQNSRRRDNSDVDAYSDDNNIATLSTVTKKGRTDVPPDSGKGRSVATARKRRSASSRLTSEQRDVTTSSIPVTSETAYLAKNNVKKEAQVAMEKKETIKETPKERKKRLALEKKQKEKERKQQEALKKKNLAKNNKSSVKFVVSSNGTVTQSSKNNVIETPVNSSSTIEVKKRKSLNSKRVEGE